MANKYFSKKDKQKKEPVTDAGFPMDIQDALVKQLDDEYDIASRNLSTTLKEGDRYYDMVHCIRENSQFEDEPNKYLPEYTQRLLTQLANFDSQYFSSRDFVDNYIDSDDPKDIAESRASRRLINAVLNLPESYYYPKVQRLLMTLNPKGYSVVKMGYRQVVEQELAGYEERTEYVEDEDGNLLDEYGYQVFDPDLQAPAQNVVQEPVYKDVIIDDRPTFDVYPNKDVYFSPEYTYTLQDKQYVGFIKQTTLSELEDEAELNGYFNLNLVRENIKFIQVSQTKTAGDGNEVPDNQQDPLVEIREQYGKRLAVEKDDGTYEPGVNKDGTKKAGATLVNCITTTVVYSHPGSSSKSKYLIRFDKSPFSVSVPAVRFLCYVDEEKDVGFGDGETSIEIQDAINDVFNLGLYRSLLATRPVFKGKKWKNIPDKIKFMSGEVLQLEDMDDLQEFNIKDDATGAMNQQAMLEMQMDRTLSVFPPTMGGGGPRAETATAASIMDQRSSVRMGLKNLNMEFIGFTEFYNILLALCNDFMLPETLINLIGNDALFLNPKRKDKFKPVTQALESEQSKRFKIQMWDNMLSKIMPVLGQNPKGFALANYIMGQQLELMGGEFKHFKNFMFEEDPKVNALYQLATGGTLQRPGGAPSPQGNQMRTGQPQNQTGLQQTGQEQMARRMMM